MALQSINIGTAANDGTGDNLRVGGDKINDNFSEIYTAFGDGSTLSSLAVTALNGATANELVTVGSTTTELDAEANLTFDGTTLAVSGNVTIANAGNIGSVGDTDAIAIASGGAVTFSQRDVHSSGITIADGGEIGSASDTDAITISAAGVATFSQRDVHSSGITVADGGQIGSASDADSIAIAANGVVTFSQAPVFPDGSIAIADLDIDGGTDIGADLVDADLFIVDDGAGGTNRKVAASRIKTYIGGGTQWQAVKTSNYTAAAGQGVFANTTSGSFTITLPAGTLGDEVTIVDYAGTFDSNALTVAADGSEKIFGSTDDLTVSTERAAFTLVFTDSTQGWLFKND